MDLPASLVDNLKTMRDVAAKDKKVAAARDAVETGLLALKDCLYGLSDVDEDDVRTVRKEITSGEMIRAVLGSFDQLEFDSRKHFSDIVLCLLHKDGAKPMVEHLRARTDLLFSLLDSVSREQQQSQTTLLFLEMLKSCFQHRALVEPVVQSEKLWTLFGCAEQPDFAVSASAFLALKELLVSFPDVLAKYVVGDRKRSAQLVERCCRLVTIGSGSQKKKSLDLVGQVLASPDSDALVPEFASSVTFARSIEKLAETLSLAALIAKVVQRLWPVASVETKEILRREVVITSLKEAKVDVQFLV